MKIYARVNILGGLSVRLPHGALDEAIALDNDPIGRARNWAEQGVDFMHIVDLDAAAYGDQRNRELIDQLTLKMNRMRQASITTEIIEVVSGAEALG